MRESNERLRRLITDEVGECCDADLEERRATLRELDERVPRDTSPGRRALKALADETRHRVVRLLVAAEGELCVCELEPLLDVSSSAVSHALSDLTDAGLVVRRKEGRWRYYRPTERAERLLGAIDATAEDGR